MQGFKPEMEILRPAGLNERRCVSRDVLGFYGSVVVCAEYETAASPTSQLPMDDIVKALKQCIVEHPVLCTVILDSQTEKPLLAKTSSMNLDEHLRILAPPQAEHSRAESLQELLELIHNEPLPNLETHPPWRLYVIPVPFAESAPVPQGFRLAFSFSHSLADGTSGMLFHKTFLRALREAHQSPFDNKRRWQVPATSEPMGPLEHIADLTISWSFLLRPLLNEFLPRMLTRAIGMSSDTPAHFWTGALARPQKPTSPKLLRTAVQVNQIPHETLQHVLTVRLTGLLVLLIARVLSGALHARDLEYNEFVVNNVIDLRRCIPKAKDVMGNLPSAVSLKIDLSPTSDLPGPVPGLTDEHWSIVRDLTEKTHRAANSLADQPITLLKYVTNIGQWTVRESSKPANASFEVSNVGVFGGDPTKAGIAPEWEIVEVIFSQSAGALDMPLDVNVANTKQGPLTVVMTWWPGMLGVKDEEHFVEEVGAGLAAELKHIASTKDPAGRLE